VVSKVREDDCYAHELAHELDYTEEHSFIRWIKNRTGMNWTEFCERVRNGSVPPRLKPRARRRGQRQRPPKNDTQE
jgi:hypothetical protein